LTILVDDRGRPGVHLFTGFAVAAATLTKISNVTLWPLAACVLLRSPGVTDTGRVSRRWSRITALVAGALLPVLFWWARNDRVFGDLTGSGLKATMLGWTAKPLGHMWDHPLFSLRGTSLFWSDLLASLWRGEFIWHGSRLASRVADRFYALSSLVLVAAALVRVTLRGSHPEGHERRAEILFLGAWVAALGFLVAASLAFDFGSCYYPSSQYPYMTSGRLIAGVLVPFAVLYVRGLDWLMTPLRSEWAGLVAVIGIVALMTLSEAALTWPVFGSAYNWFHIP